MEGAHDPDCRRCMPWSEIESEENQKKIATMRKLIMLRRNEKVCRSLHFHFPNGYENDRCVEYIKLDEEGNKIEVLLNASDEEIKVKGDGEVLFAREFDGEILGVNGTLNSQDVMVSPVRNKCRQATKKSMFLEKPPENMLF